MRRIKPPGISSRAIRGAAILAAALLLLAGAALANGGADIGWWVIAGGGSPSASGSVDIYDTLGQPFAGPCSSGDLTLKAGYWYGVSIPTAVELISFAAVVQGGAVLVTWETASEVDSLGFHLYRADSADGPQARLNEELIPSQSPGGAAGAAYRFVDAAVEPGVVYYYWLEAVDVRGAATRHGPVSAAALLGPSHGKLPPPIPPVETKEP